ncbi:MAG: endolytic transglycosylase MltG [Acidimicrobiales bacterium]
MSEQQDVLPPGYAGNQQWSGPRHGRQGRRGTWFGRHRGLSVLIAILVILALIVAGLAVWAESQINPGRAGPEVSVHIPAGSSTSTIGSILARAGVVRDAGLFALYVKVHGDGPLYPGTYTLAKDSSYQAAISTLEKGPTVLTDRLVIPEGYTLHQIAASVAALPGLRLSAKAFLAAATSGQVRSPYEPAGVNNLEGLLFPATYDVSQHETVVDVLEKMIGAFDDQAASIGLTAAAARLHMTPYQVVTVASIVEREAKLSSDRPDVASVIYNRLRAGTPLGADSTQTYYLRQSDPGLVPTVRQLDSPSPYNTRLNKGLPPTPISDPGLPSLQAASSPPSTSYLYFVEVKPDGQLGFASTSQGFSQLQDQCRAAKLC